MFLRPVASLLRSRIEEPRRFIQALIRPRQTGKTTLARQIVSDSKMITRFILTRGNTQTANEVKSGRRKTCLAGMDTFSKEFRVKRKLLVGGDGIPLEEFFLAPAAAWPK